MKILLAHSDPKLPARESVDLWRIIRPFKELEKHVDWQIDHIDHLWPTNAVTATRVPADKIIEHLLKLKDYDIIWTSYFPDAFLFDALTFLQEQFGTKIVVDCDDDMFHIPEHNHIWKAAGKKGIHELQWMVEQAPYLVTSSENLKTEFSSKRKNPTYLLPNFVSEDYKHKKFDNKDNVVIGFFGSVTHKHDIFNTGFFDALQQIMHKYKNVRVGTVGLSIDAYLPKQRYQHHPGKAGRAWLTEVWPNINIDISVAPLEDTVFNRAKTNIKWLESAMIPAAFIGSNIPPYRGSVEHGKTGLLTDNSTEGWYEALEKLVTDGTLRNRLANAAKKKVSTDWHVENNWQTLKNIIEDINA